MERYRPVEVMCYSGSKGDEEPRAVVLDGRRYQVLGVIERWEEEDMVTGERRCAFVLDVRGLEGEVRVFRLDDGGWFQVIHAQGGSG